jgi:hypothetical protein
MLSGTLPSLFAKPLKVGVRSTPSSTAKIIICSKCMEPTAMKRKCCNALYCDHCYTKTDSCPHCGVQTKQEALTGATYQVQVFSEHEECRCCLDPGILRKCCNNYYCDDCYYKVPNCRSCGDLVGKVGKNNWLLGLSPATIMNALLGWAVTIFVVAIAIIMMGIIITVELRKPITIFNNKCYGFFRTCDRTRK